MRIYVNDNATGPTKLFASLTQRASTGRSIVANAIANTTGTTLTAGTGADQILTATVTTMVASATAYNLKVATSTGSALVVVKLVEVDYDAL